MTTMKDWALVMQVEILVKDNAKLEMQVKDLLVRNHQLTLENQLLKAKLEPNPEKL